MLTKVGKQGQLRKRVRNMVRPNTTKKRMQDMRNTSGTYWLEQVQMPPSRLPHAASVALASENPGDTVNRTEREEEEEVTIVRGRKRRRRMRT